MNLTLAQSVELARAVKDGAASGEVAVFTPFTALTVVAEVLRGSAVRLGAQDAYWEASGAYTGEVSMGMLTDAERKARRALEDAKSARMKIGRAHV